MNSVAVSYLYLVACKCNTSIHGLSYPTTTFGECIKRKCIKREFLELPFKLETKDDILNAEKILLEKIKSEEEKIDKTGYYTSTSACEIIGFHPLVSTI